MDTLEIAVGGVAIKAAGIYGIAGTVLVLGWIGPGHLAVNAHGSYTSLDVEDKKINNINVKKLNRPSSILSGSTRFLLFESLQKFEFVP